MKELSVGLPMILTEEVKFKCFSGFVKGTVALNVYDKETNEFPAHVTVKTNLGNGGTDIILKGNETIHKNIHGIEIEATISEWKCTSTELSFHVKVEAKKKVWPTTLKCKVIDRTLSGKRYNSAATGKRIEGMLDEVEQAMGKK